MAKAVLGAWLDCCVPRRACVTPTAWPIPLPPPVTNGDRMLFDIKCRPLAAYNNPIDSFFSIDKFDADDDFGDQLSALQKQKIIASFWE
jgi:hypothetical protein